MRTNWIRPVAVDCEVFVEVETERAPKKRTKFNSSQSKSESDELVCWSVASGLSACCFRGEPANDVSLAPLCASETHCNLRCALYVQDGSQAMLTDLVSEK